MGLAAEGKKAFTDEGEASRPVGGGRNELVRKFNVPMIYTRGDQKGRGRRLPRFVSMSTTSSRVTRPSLSRSKI